MFETRVTPGPGATIDTGDGYVELFDLFGDDTKRDDTDHRRLGFADRLHQVILVKGVQIDFRGGGRVTA